MTEQTLQLLSADTLLPVSDEVSRAVVVMPPGEATPMTMLAAAFERGASLEQLDKLLALQERWEANEARKAFVSAMARFKTNAPKILKDKLVRFETNSGDVTSYKHATLGSVCEAAIKGLAEVGISHHWVLDQSVPGTVKVTCVLTHELGHSTQTPLIGPHDNSGKKNPIQQMASTVSYLERYTLLAATGLATKDMDDDGHGSADEEPLITEEQVMDIEALITEVGANRAKFLEYGGIQDTREIRASKYNDAVAMLQAKGRSRQ